MMGHSIRTLITTTCALVTMLSLAPMQARASEQNVATVDERIPVGIQLDALSTSLDDPVSSLDSLAVVESAGQETGTQLSALASNPYPWGQCTWYVWQRANACGGMPTIYSDAGGWYEAAPSVGLARGTTPKVNSIVVFSGGQYGHVAWVEGVHNGLIDIAETNVKGLGVVSTRTVPSTVGSTVGSQRIVGYVYVAGTIESATPLPATKDTSLGSTFYASLRMNGSDKCVGQDGTNVCLWAATPDNYGVTIWKFENTGDGAYKISSVRTGQCMTVSGGKDTNNANVTTAPYSGSDAQRWYFYRRSNGMYFLRPRLSSGRNLDVESSGTANRTNVQIYSRNDLAGQCFTIQRESELVNMGDFTAILHLASPKAVIGRQGSNVEVTGEAQSNYDRTLWRFAYDANKGCYIISSVMDGQCLDVTNAKDANGTNVGIWRRSGATNQDWWIFKLSDGTYRLISGCSYRSLDVDSAQSKIGTNVQIWNSENAASQKFAIYVVKSSSVNKKTSYAIAASASTIRQGASSTIKVTNTSYVYNYKFHVVDPAGMENVVDNGCNPNYTLVGSKVGTYRVFAEVTCPSNVSMGALTDRSVAVRVDASSTSLAQATIASIARRSYTGSAIKPTPAVTLAGRTLVLGTDYTLSYANNTKVGTATVTATGKGAYTGSKSATFQIVATPSVAYRTHVQRESWQNWVADGKPSGTSGKSLRLEGIEAKLSGVEGGIEYRTHVQGYGWMAWMRDGAMSGTLGEGKRLEAIEMRLTGEAAGRYDLWYRVHAQSYGWMGWAKNGGSAGTATYGKRIEAIQIVVLEKGAGAPTGIEPASATAAPYATRQLAYRTHVQSFGWQGWVRDGDLSGTSGQSKRLEGIEIKFEDPLLSGGIEYRTHVQGYGWMAWMRDGAMSGTSGESKRLEAIEMRLTGAMAEGYDVWYRVHAQHFGWLGWTKNGGSAGTEGYGYRLEAIEIKLVEKGGTLPSPTKDAFRKRVNPDARTAYTTKG